MNLDAAVTIPRSVRIYNAPLPRVSKTEIAMLRNAIEDWWDRNLRAPRAVPAPPTIFEAARARALAPRARATAGWSRP